jgi:hypothetical protein
VLAFQLSHILLGHKIDTSFAFNDKLLFPNESTFERIPMGHTAVDNEEAAKKAMELLNNSPPYKEKIGNAGLYLRQLHALLPALTALTTARLGDSLVKDPKTGEMWQSNVEAKGNKLEITNVTQIAANSLGSRVKVDSWDDSVSILKSKPVAYYTPRDKMPFEVTPVFVRLTRYTGAVAAAPVTATTAPATAAPAADAPAQ